MKIPFSKLHGLGNDYLFLDALQNPELAKIDFVKLAIDMSHRRLGPGADGIVIILPSVTDAVAMRIFNCDGSEAEMCGNALRCVARLCRERKYVSDNCFTIEIGERSVGVCLDPADITYQQVSINIGTPCFQKFCLPMIGEGSAQKIILSVDNRDFDATCVSIGNPHCVIFLDEIKIDDVLRYGPQIENHSLFPQKTNSGFCSVQSRSQIELIVWERGAGMTGACGSGAAAAFAASRLRHLVDPHCSVKMPGGSLDFHQNTQGELQMVGPAIHVYDGIWFTDGTY